MPKTRDSSRFNNVIAFMRQVFDLAIKEGIIYKNPAEDLERMPVRQKKLQLPTKKRFAEFLAEMRMAHSRFSKHCADLAEGLACTGLRIGEAGEVEWQHLRFDDEEITVVGDPEEATKNSEIRYVPMIEQAKALFQRMRAERPDEPMNAKVFKVRECQKSMDRAAEKIGMARITHHDLRHFFATICIESGVDIPTVSRWLGHKDGGALAMKTYGHLRREHSIAQAKKVSLAA
ncbi:MAG: site-specific integrase [Chthoniobacteraceae bacterium]